MTENSISIVIPTLNVGNQLSRLLSSIREQSVQPAEVIVVDGASSDETEEIAERGGAFVLHETGTGDRRSAAKNLGAERAVGDFLLFLDADMELEPDLIAECERLSNHASHSDFALSIPEISVGTGLLGRTRSWERSVVQAQSFLTFSRFLSRGLFFAAGRFDQALSHLEDLDLQARLLRRGVRPRATVAHILHYEELGWIASLERQSRYTSGWRKFRVRHPEVCGPAFSPLGRGWLYVSAVRTVGDVLPFAIAVSYRATALAISAVRRVDL